jgi:hypothetical protein
MAPACRSVQPAHPPLSHCSTLQVEVTRRREREGSSPPSSILFCSTHVIDEDDVTAIAGEAVVMLVHKDKGKGEEQRQGLNVNGVNGAAEGPKK